MNFIGLIRDIFISKFRNANTVISNLPFNCFFLYYILIFSEGNLDLLHFLQNNFFLLFPISQPHSSPK